MTKVAVYLRVSKADGLPGESNTIETQRRRIKGLCESRGWVYGTEYIDDGLSASKARGPGTAWHRMLELINTDEFDVIAALDLDRLLRTMTDLATLLELKAKVTTADGEIDLTTADGEFRATMLMAVARFEVRRKTERLERANETRRLKGQPIVNGGKILGYTADGMHVIPDEAAAVKAAFEDYLSGVKITHVAKELTAKGYTSSRGRPWSNDNIRSMFQNTRYKGVISKWEPDPKKRHERGSALRPETYPGNFEAIVSAELFDAVQVELNAWHRQRKWSNDPKYLLSGIANCGACNDGTKVFAGYYQRTAYVGKNGVLREFEAVRQYRCMGRRNIARNLQAVDDFVEDRLLSRLAQPDIKGLFAKVGDSKLNVDELHAERQALQQRVDGLVSLASEGLLSMDKVRVESIRLRERIMEIDEMLKPKQMSPLAKLALSNDILADWNEMNMERKRLIVQSAMEVTILPSTRGAKGFNPDLIRINWHHTP